MTNLQLRVISAGVLIPLAIWVIVFAPVWVFVHFIWIVSVLMLREWLTLVSPDMTRHIRGLLLLSMAVLVYVSGQGQLLATTSLVMSLGVVMVCIFGFLGVWHFKNNGKLLWGGSLVLSVAVAFAVVLLCGVASIQLKFGAGVSLLLYVIVNVWMMDIFAYFAGKRFGTIKLIPAVSPGKSAQGLFGGLLANVCFSVLVGVICLDDIPLWLLTVMGVAIGLLSVLGDLFESCLKRHAGKKDSGNLLPGHGGVLDRMDGLLFSMPLAWLMLVGADAI